MSQQVQLNIKYPFGDPNKQVTEDAQSYHSITNDEKKLRYFEQPGQSPLPKMSQSSLRRKNPLPPLYPYEEVQRLKQSLKIQKKQRQNIDNFSINSMDSFHTANQFQSICYEEGDYEKIVENLQRKQNSLNGKQRLSNRQGDKSNKQNYLSTSSFKSISYGQGEKKQKSSNEVISKNIPMQQSSALNDVDIDELQNAQSSDQKYQGFEERNQIKQNERQNPILNQYPEEHDKQIEISHIQNALNESELMDHEILQLTRELHRIQSSQQELQQQNKFSSEFIEKQQLLAQRYKEIESRLKELQQTQRNFSSQIVNMHQLMKKTKENNSYLKKEVQFFKKKTKQIQQKQKLIQDKERKLKEKQLNTSKNHSLSFGQQKIKPKTYHIRPKAPNNQSLQSRKYKQLTFQYSLGSEHVGNQDIWNDLEVDTQNNPPEYKLIYSFQHQNTVLVVRLVDLISNESSRSSLNTKKIQAQSSSVKKNYQYLVDFSHNKYGNQQQKLQSLGKQLVINLQLQKYQCKQFTKKIEIFLMICQDQTYVDLIKMIPLPNPLAFYVQKRFIFLEENKKISMKSNQEDSKNGQNQNQVPLNSGIKEALSNFNAFKNLNNLAKFMKTYIIRIEHMADVQSIQKLMNLDWINATSNQELRYFSIKAQSQENSQKSNQLFFVKVDDCVLQNGPQYDKLDQKYRYSLVFRVGSTTDNDLLVDLIEFLTFLTVL